MICPRSCNLSKWRREAEPAVGASPFPLLPPFTQPMPTAGKTPKAHILLGLSQWHPGPIQREEAHWSQEEMELPNRKRNQRLEDSWHILCCKYGKSHIYVVMLDLRNLRKLKICKYLIHTPFPGRKMGLSPDNPNLSSWALNPSFPGELPSSGYYLWILSSLLNPSSFDPDIGCGKTEDSGIMAAAVTTE